EKGTAMTTKIHECDARMCAAILALVLVPCQPVAAQEPIEVKAGISDPVNTVLAWYMARDAGLYAAGGLRSTSSICTPAATARPNCRLAGSTSCMWGCPR